MNIFFARTEWDDACDDVALITSSKFGDGPIETNYYPIETEQDEEAMGEWLGKDLQKAIDSGNGKIQIIIEAAYSDMHGVQALERLLLNYISANNLKDLVDPTIWVYNSLDMENIPYIPKDTRAWNEYCAELAILSITAYVKYGFTHAEYHAQNS